MESTLFVLLGSVMLLCMCCGNADKDSMDSDLEAIEELHKKDQMASLNGDIETLMSLFTEDGILIPPDREIVKGREELKRMLLENYEQYKDYQIVDYVHDFEEIKVIGDYAYEWGTYRGKYKSRRDDTEITGSGKLLRILKRQKDGSWKISRSIWNVAKE